MMFNSIEFIFYIIFCFAIYYSIPIKFKRAALVLIGLVWYSQWQNEWALLLLGTSLLTYSYLKAGSALDLREKKWHFPFIVTLNIALFIFLKSIPLIWENQKTPFGTSFIMLALIGNLIDIWRFDRKTEIKSFFGFLLPFFFFPTLMAGPIERKKFFDNQFNNIKDIEFKNVQDGVLIFGLGFLKWQLFHEPFFNLVNKLLVDSQNKIFFVIIGALLNCFLAYIDFSSFCDMGRGVARIFSVQLNINFRPFYYAKNPNDYWQRWNISLATWIRDYVTMPLLLNFGRKINNNIIILFSFILIGLWHGIEWNWLIFGLYNGLVIILYTISQRRFSHNLKFIGHFLVVLIFLFSGLLQQQNSLAILKNVFSNFSMGLSSLNELADI